MDVLKARARGNTVANSTSTVGSDDDSRAMVWEWLRRGGRCHLVPQAPLVTTVLAKHVLRGASWERLPEGAFRQAVLVLGLLAILECHEPFADRVSLALLTVRAGFLEMQRLIGIADGSRPLDRTFRVSK